MSTPASLLDDPVYGHLGLLDALGPGADYLSGAEYQGGGLGLVQVVHKARELLGLVFHPVQGHGNKPQVEGLSQGRGCYHVFDFDITLAQTA